MPLTAARPAGPSAAPGASCIPMNTLPDLLSDPLSLIPLISVVEQLLAKLRNRNIHRIAPQVIPFIPVWLKNGNILRLCRSTTILTPGAMAGSCRPLQLPLSPLMKPEHGSIHSCIWNSSVLDFETDDLKENLIYMSSA